MLDGKGTSVRFHVPRDLEADASGKLYLIDGRRIRTIDAEYEVKTLNLSDKKFIALNADHAGNMHALEYKHEDEYVWHKLADGSEVAIRTSNASAEFIPRLTVATFTVVGDDIIFSYYVSRDKKSLKVE